MIKTLKMSAFLFGVTISIAYALTIGVPVVLDGATQIHAGDAWALEITLDDATAGETVNVTLFNGLQIFEETLTLGSGGVAVWEIQAGEITQAGESLVVMRYGDLMQQRSLRVLPGEPVEADLFTTNHNLPAYGDGAATLMLLPRDRRGNPPEGDTPFTLDVRFPNGDTATPPFTYTGGIGRLALQSRGAPGRVRLMLPEIAANPLELTQTPGNPAQLTIQVTPECVPNDGRDLVRLLATVHDAHGHPVTDGTLVTFAWWDGFGYGRTVDGQAVLEIPAPPAPGRHTYRAGVGQVVSARVTLYVSEGGCDDG